jgi:hypothetical protein
MKFTLTLLMAVFLFSFSKAETESKVIFQNNFVKITSSTEQCHDNQNGIHQEYTFLSLQNLSSQKLEVSYNKELWYDGKCINCIKSSEEYKFKVVLEPNQTLSGNCTKKEKALSIFSKFLNMKKAELTKFELRNIEIKNITK